MKKTRSWMILLFATTLLLFSCSGVSGIAAGQTVELTEKDSSPLSKIGYLQESTGSEENTIDTSHIEAALWQKRFGGEGSDEGYSVQQTSDGGYIIAGYSETTGKAIQIYVIKTNGNGVKTWQKRFGGAGNENGLSVKQTTDGGYIIAGWSDTTGKGKQVYLIKTNGNGVKTWQKRFGGAGEDAGSSVQQTTDGGYIIAGWSETTAKGKQVYLIKTNEFGRLQWQKKFGGDLDDAGRSVQQTVLGGYIIAGWSDTTDKGYQVLLIKTTAAGKKQWQKRFGGAGEDFGESVWVTPYGTYLVCGTTYTTTDQMIYLIRTDSMGVKSLEKSFGRDLGDYGNSVQGTNDGGIIIVGTSRTTGEGLKVLLIKTDSKGVKLWQRHYGVGYGFSVQQTSDAGYIIAGSSITTSKEKQVYLIRTGSEG